MLGQPLQDSKTTTAAGAITTIAGIALALLPTEVRAGCVNAVMSTNQPILVGGLLAIGLGLTLIGPSLTKKA